MRETGYGTELTSRQREVLDYIKRFIVAEGFPPTRSELAMHFGWNSANAAEDHIRALERKGALTITKGVARGINVVSNNMEGPVGKLALKELQAWRNEFPAMRFNPSTGRVTPH